MQAVLRLACVRVAGVLEPRKGEFLRRWVAGESIAGIAASVGLSRSHLSRRWRPQVLADVDAEIANLRRVLHWDGGDLTWAPDAREPAAGASHAPTAPAAARHGRSQRAN